MAERMLHIAGSMSPSGIGNYIMNVYRHVDREKVQFDFLLCEKRDVSFDDEIEALGGRIFYITRKSVNPFKNFLETERIVKREGYKTVFRHTDISTVAVDLLACALGGAKNRIPHSHSTSTPNKKAHALFKPLLNFISTRRFACSDAAGRWLYGDGVQFEFIKNAIDLKDFAFNERVRESIRSEFGIEEDTMLIGHVGNLLPVKNHMFLLGVLKKLVEKDFPVRMLFAGDGVMRKSIEEKAKNLGISDFLILPGVRNDIPALLMAMDVFCFPSKYEGLPIAMVEAQKTGLPCIISERINSDCDVCGELIKRLPIEAGCEDLWRDEILNIRDEYHAFGNTGNRLNADNGFYAGNRGENNNGVDLRFAQKGFDINEMVKVYEDMVL